jgi:hypothetical protein
VQIIQFRALPGHVIDLLQAGRTLSAGLAGGVSQRTDGSAYSGSWLWIQRSSAGPLSTLTMTAYRFFRPAWQPPW